jgi:hypothetical protein
MDRQVLTEEYSCADIMAVRRSPCLVASMRYALVVLLGQHKSIRPVRTVHQPFINNYSWSSSECRTTVRHDTFLPLHLVIDHRSADINLGQLVGQTP